MTVRRWTSAPNDPPRRGAVCTILLTHTVDQDELDGPDFPRAVRVLRKAREHFAVDVTLEPLLHVVDLEHAVVSERQNSVLHLSTAEEHSVVRSRVVLVCPTESDRQAKKGRIRSGSDRQGPEAHAAPCVNVQVAIVNGAILCGVLCAL